MIALAWVDEGGTSRSGPSWEEFSRGTGLPPPSHTVFDALVESGWIERVGSHSYRFKITPSGRRKREELWAGRDPALRRDPASLRSLRARPRRLVPPKAGRRDPASLLLGGALGAAAGALGTSAYVGLKRSKHGDFILPPHHDPGLRVPRGGSSCANCKYVYYPASSGARLGPPHCWEPSYVLWNKGTRIPVEDARDYCSDWWAPNAEAQADIARHERGERRR